MKRTPGLKPKDLMMLPARIAIAMQEAGWLLRSEIIWAKSNPMPESAKDRPTQSHEKIYLLAKQARYYYDEKAVREPDGGRSDKYGFQGRQGGAAYHAKSGGEGSAGWVAVIGRNMRNVWSLAPPQLREAHFATFPPELARRCILAGCPAGGMVLDPFGGAGTTGLVAARLGRSATLIELNPEYAAIALRRIDRENPFSETSEPGAVQMSLFQSATA